MAKADEQEIARVRYLLASRSEYVVGIDEVGIGALAGPIAVGAVVTKVDWDNELVKDSKKYSSSKKTTAHQKRLRVLNNIIIPEVLHHSHILLESQEVDQLGLRDAWLRCLWLVAKQCLHHYPQAVVVVDGDSVGAVPTSNAMAIPKGDNLVPAVSAASVLAKVQRDKIMLMLDGVYPVYGFSQHKGYGTRQHMVALEEHGPCPVHRRSYTPVKQAEAEWQKTRQHKNETPA